MSESTITTDLLTRAEAASIADLTDLSHDQVAELMELVDAAKSRVRQADETLKAAVLAWCIAKGPITRGDMLTTASSKKTEKCKSIPAAIEAIFLAVGGDYDAFCDVLSVNSIKAGAAKKLLGYDKFDELWETKIEMTLENKPVKVLKTVNQKFVK